MKRILFIGGLTSGGAEHQMVVVATLLKKEGYDVSYFCPGDGDFFQKDLEKSGIPILRIRENRLSSLLKLNIPRITLLVRRILKRGSYDTVVSFLGLWNFENCFFAKKRNTQHKAITGIRNNRNSVFLDRQEKFFTRFEKYADTIVSNSDNAKRVFSDYFPEHSTKLTTIYNIVDLPEIHTKYSIKKDNKLHIIVPASYREVKNPMGLLKALTLIDMKERNLLQIDWYGNIKGGQACYDQMVAFIDKNNLNDVIRLFDATTDIANKINEADIVGLFSSSEGLPNSICEGMMLGKPVVMTRVSDYDVLVEPTNGFLCDWDNPQSIREALVKAARLSDYDLLKMGQCSKNKAKTLFSKETILRQWIQII